MATFGVSASDLVDGAAASTCSPASGATFAAGSTTVTCTATDKAGNAASSSFTIVVRDTPPTLSLPGSLTIEATSPLGAVATFTAHAADVVDGSDAVICAPASGSIVPLGVTTISCSATNKAGATSMGSFRVTVQDTTPPTIASVTPSLTTLWPPNHHMIPVTISVADHDAVDPIPACGITGVTSNESISATTWHITANLALNLLADRDGTGTGRIYAVSVACTDQAGNTTSATTTVVVPHDMGK